MLWVVSHSYQTSERECYILWEKAGTQQGEGGGCFGGLGGSELWKQGLVSAVA